MNYSAARARWCDCRICQSHRSGNKECLFLGGICEGKTLVDAGRQTSKDNDTIRIALGNPEMLIDPSLFPLAEGLTEVMVIVDCCEKQANEKQQTGKNELLPLYASIVNTGLF